MNCRTKKVKRDANNAITATASRLIFKKERMKKLLNILLLSAAILLSGCEEESPYSGYRVNFSFDSGIHPYIQAKSFGQFICVERKGAGQYTLTDARGGKQIVNIPQIQLQQNPFYYGLGGLIIGTPSAYGDGSLVAYDKACPKCDYSNRKVVIDYVMGYAKCDKCNSTFDLNSGGIAIEGNSRPLWRYRVFENGSTVVLQN